MSRDEHLPEQIVQEATITIVEALNVFRQGLWLTEDTTRKRNYSKTGLERIPSYPVSPSCCSFLFSPVPICQLPVV